MMYFIKTYNDFLLFTYKEGTKTSSIQYMLNDYTLHNLDAICVMCNNQNISWFDTIEILNKRIPAKFNITTKRNFWV